MDEIRTWTDREQAQEWAKALGGHVEEVQGKTPDEEPTTLYVVGLYEWSGRVTTIRYHTCAHRWTKQVQVTDV